MRTVLVNAVSARSGGAETYICNLLRSLRGTPFRFIFLVPGSHLQHYQSVGSCKLIGIWNEANSAWSRIWFDQWTIRTLVKKFKVDILVASSDFGTLFAPCRQLLMVRNALFFSDFYVKEILAKKRLRDRVEYLLKRELVRASIKSADMVVTASHTMLDEVTRSVRIPRDRLRVNPFGVDLGRFRLPAEAEQTREAETEIYGEIRILFVSEYADYKNLTTLLRAVRVLLDRGVQTFRVITTLDPSHFPDVDLVSRATDTALCNDVNIAKHLDIVGKVAYPQVEELFRNSDIFVFPSLVESFGHPLIEAMASGLPIVASDIPINREICGDAAVYFSPLSPEELANLLESMIGDPGSRKRLGGIGRKRAEAHFDWNDHMRRMIAVLEMLAETE